MAACKIERLEVRRLFNGAPSIAADPFEPNNSFAAATDFGTIGLRVENDLTVHAANNDDYYTFTADLSGTANISISFVHAQGDLDLLLYDSAHAIIGSSTGITNGESIQKPVTSGQQYFVLVFEANSGTSPDYDLSIDAPAHPTVIDKSFDFATSHNLIFSFNKDVEASLLPTDVSVTDVFGNPISGPASVSYDAGTDTATFHFGLILADGDYIATLAAGNVEDDLGNSMADDAVLPFFVYQADADHDRTVDTVDFNLLAANFGLGGRTFGQGDFNYDSQVDTVDFNLLAGKFGQTLSSPRLGAAGVGDLFSSQLLRRSTNTWTTLPELE
jgi:hypothetical protein